MIGTSDQSCWLAEACKILLLLLLTRFLSLTSLLKLGCLLEHCQGNFSVNTY